MGHATKRILVVDDERINQRILEGFLKSFGHEPVSVDSGPEALALLDSGFDLVLLDVMMPGMDGFAVAQEIRKRPRDAEIPIVMVTALSGREDRLKAVQAGANDFIAKPIDKTELKVRTDSLLRMKESRDQVRRYQAELEDMVKVRTEALRLAVDNLTELQKQTVSAHRETILCLSAAAEFKDEETAEHIQRMSEYSALLAERAGLPRDEVEFIRLASPMHDIGKIGIPDSILLKPGRLDPAEWKTMQSHTVIGGHILGSGSAVSLQTGRTIALTHHEKWDGSGYPKGLAGEAIPMAGRICALADVFDALLSRRPYKEPFPLERTLEIMTQGRGSHFDPDLFDLFMANLPTILEIKDRFQDREKQPAPVSPPPDAA